MAINATDVHVGRQVMACRLARSLSVRTVANWLDLQSKEYEACEAGISHLGEQQLMRLANKLDVNQALFFAGHRAH